MGLKSKFFQQKKWARIVALSLALMLGSTSAYNTWADTSSTTTDATTTATKTKPAAPPSDSSSTSSDHGTPPSGTPPTGTPPEGEPPAKPEGENGAVIQKEVVTGTGLYTLSTGTASKSNETLTSNTANESVVKVSNGASLTLDHMTLTKSSGNTTSEESSNFNGLNATVLAEGKSSITLSKSTIKSDADGSNAVFATGEGTKINISDSVIDTKQNSSRGLDATYNGTIVAKNMTITTAGVHSAGLATDRGEGNVTLVGGSVKTTGVDSPAIYSTGNISVSDATLTATGSEAAVVEGKNSITLKNVQLSGAKKQGVMIYQSFSGDAGVGTGKFTMTGGSLSASTGALFYATNTHAVVNLTNVNLKSTSGVLVNAQADRWGKTNENGATIDLTVNNQKLSGKITADKISQVNVNLNSKSSFVGAINNKNTAKYTSIKLDKNSTWTVTENSYVSVITDADSKLSNIKSNGKTIYYDATQTANKWLNGKTIKLNGGGYLKPMSK